MWGGGTRIEGQRNLLGTSMVFVEKRCIIEIGHMNRDRDYSYFLGSVFWIIGFSVLDQIRTRRSQSIWPLVNPK